MVYRNDYDPDLDSEYTPMINVFHLEQLDNPKGVYCSNSPSDLYEPLAFSSGDVSEPNLLEKNAKLNTFVQIRPYAPSLEFVGRKRVSSGSSYSSELYSNRKYSSSQSRPHPVYTDRPYSASSSLESLYFTRPISSYRSTSDRGYSPEILPFSSHKYTSPNRSYSSFNSSSAYRRGPISSAITHHSRDLTSSISDYTRNYSSLY